MFAETPSTLCLQVRGPDRSTRHQVHSVRRLQLCYARARCSGRSHLRRTIAQVREGDREKIQESTGFRNQGHVHYRKIGDYRCRRLDLCGAIRGLSTVGPIHSEVSYLYIFIIERHPNFWKRDQGQTIAIGKITKLLTDENA